MRGICLLLGVTLLVTISCKERPCGSIDYGDLKAVSTCFYEQGKPLVPKDKWALFAKVGGKDELPLQERARRFGTSCLVQSSKVLSKKDTKGKFYALVSVQYKCKTCTDTDTDTWIRVKGKWKVISLPKTYELAKKRYNKGDYAGAIKGYQAYLKINPFNINALDSLIFALQRKGGPGVARVPAIIRNILALNPNDSDGLFSAISHTRDFDIAKAFLNKLQRSDCRRKSAVFNLALDIKSWEGVLGFLDAQKVESNSVAMRRIQAYAALKKKKQLKALYQRYSYAKLSARLNRSDPSFAASWAVNLGRAFLSIGEAKEARRWMNYAILKDPNDRKVVSFVKQLKALK